MVLGSPLESAVRCFSLLRLVNASSIFHDHCSIIVVLDLSCHPNHRCVIIMITIPEPSDVQAVPDGRRDAVLPGVAYYLCQCRFSLADSSVLTFPYFADRLGSYVWRQ